VGSATFVSLLQSVGLIVSSGRTSIGQEPACHATANSRHISRLDRPMILKFTEPIAVAVQSRYNIVSLRHVTAGCKHNVFIAREVLAL
jgi:hypothetical protein